MQSRHTFTYGGVEFNASFGMLCMKDFWEAANEGMTGSEFLVNVVYLGNRAYHALNGGKPVFNTKADVYALIESACTKPETQNEEITIISTFTECEAYKWKFQQAVEANQEKKS